MHSFRCFAVIIFTTVCAFDVSAQGQNIICANSEAKAAELAAASIVNWHDASEVFLKFRQCDDGSIAEAFADSIGHLLTQSNPDLSTLALEIRANPGLKKFILRHVDETLPHDVLEKISNELPKIPACKTLNKKLCREISRAAGRAMDTEVK